MEHGDEILAPTSSLRTLRSVHKMALEIFHVKMGRLRAGAWLSAAAKGLQPRSQIVQEQDPGVLPPPLLSGLLEDAASRA